MSGDVPIVETEIPARPEGELEEDRISLRSARHRIRGMDTQDQFRNRREGQTGHGCQSRLPTTIATQSAVGPPRPRFGDEAGFRKTRDYLARG